MAPALEPEIRRCDPTAAILELKCLDLDIEGVDFMDQPDEGAGQFVNTDLSVIQGF